MTNERNTGQSDLISKYNKKLAKLLSKKEGWGDEYWYRGQKFANWKLQSGAHQRLEKLPSEKQDLIKYHELMIESARLMGEGRDSGGRELRDLELLAKLQHIGAATCLMDFTTNFFVALWFACQEVDDYELDPDERGEIRHGKVFVVPIGSTQNPHYINEVRSYELDENIDYFLDPEMPRKEAPRSREQQFLDNLRQILSEHHGRLSSHSRHVENSPPQGIGSYDKAIRSELRRQSERKGKDQKFWYWTPEALMGRMLTQASRFVFGSMDISEPNYRGEYDCILVEKNDKDRLLLELKQHMGLKLETVFSDIHGLAGMFTRNVRPQEITAEAYNYSGVRRLLSGKLPEGVRDFERATRLDPNNPYFWLMLGSARGLLADYTADIRLFRSARENFKQALDLLAVNQEYRTFRPSIIGAIARYRHTEKKRLPNSGTSGMWKKFTPELEEEIGRELSSWAPYYDLEDALRRLDDIVKFPATQHGDRPT